MDSYREGRLAFFDGEPVDANPYLPAKFDIAFWRNVNAIDWVYGWYDAANGQKAPTQGLRREAA